MIPLRTIKIILLTVLSTLLLSSCFNYRKNTLKFEKDVALGTNRGTWSTYYWITEGGSSKKLEQNVLREERQGQKATYTVYDKFIHGQNGFSLEEKAFIIIDEKAYALEVQESRSYVTSSLKKNEESMLTSDSTQVTVVTDVSKEYKDNFELISIIPDDAINALASSENVSFQYYAGPDMLRFDLREAQLEKFKFLATGNHIQ